MSNSKDKASRHRRSSCKGRLMKQTNKPSQGGDLVKTIQVKTYYPYQTAINVPIGYYTSKVWQQCAM